MEEEIQENPLTEEKKCCLPCCSCSGWKVIVCVIVGLLILAGAVYAGIQIEKKQLLNRFGNRETPPTPLEENLITPTPDKTNWKAYEFGPLQLVLKVPLDLFVQTGEPNPGKDFTAYIQNYPINAPATSENSYQLYIFWQKTPAITQAEFQQLKNDLEASSVEDTTIAGYPAIKGQIKGERNRFVTYILKDGAKISLFTSEPTQTNKELTDQIISTFKFLDQASVDETKDWKTYKNENSLAAVRYSLKYPDGWVVNHQEGSRGAGYDNSRDQVILTKGDFNLAIYQDAITMGGESPCQYPGDPEIDDFYRPTLTTYGSFTELNIAGKSARRAKPVSSNQPTSPNKDWFYVCEKKRPMVFSNHLYWSYNLRSPPECSNINTRRDGFYCRNN